MSAESPDARPVEPSQYEFTTDQNKQIADLASKMWLVGTVLLVVGILGIVSSVLSMFSHAPANPGGGTLFQGILNFLLGLFTRRAADAFDKIVRTEGADITHLMQALRSLGAVYGIFWWLIVIALVLMALWIVVMILALAGVGVAGLFR